MLLTVVLHRHERAGREQGLRDTARALSLAVDRELQGPDRHPGCSRHVDPSEGIGRGATFVVQLPLAGGAIAPAVRRDAGGEFPRLDGIRVLVVDDEPDARAL